MSRFIAVENLSSYISQIKSTVSSLLCNHTSMKCVTSSTSTEYFSCSYRFIEQLQITHPYHSLVIDTIETFHKKYDGCSCKTLLVFLCEFYSQLQIVFDKSNRLSQKKIFNHLEQLIDQSISIAEENFIENLILNSHTFLRICRFQTIYSNSLYEAYLYFTSSKQKFSYEDLINHFDNLNVITRVKYSIEQCRFIPGTILPIDKPIEGNRRTILLDGYLLEDYVHVGYNNKLKLKQTSVNSSWHYVISSILDQYSIDVILCTGRIDEKLKTIRNNDKRVFIENLPSKIFRLFEQKLIVNYLTDVNEDNVILLNYVQSNDDATMIFIEKGSTIVQYVPLECLVDVKNEQFVHCLTRFRQILRKKFYLKGSGEFENDLYKYFYNKKQENSSLENNLAYECFLQCLQSFVNEIFNSKDLFEKNIIDDFDSKFDAWKTSIELLKILTQIDNVIQIVDNENLSDI